MKWETDESADSHAPGPAQEGKFTAKKTSKHVSSATAKQFMKDYDKTVEKNRETDWLNSNERKYVNEPVPVAIEPKREVQIPPFWKDVASNQTKPGSQQQAEEKTKTEASNEQYKERLRMARINMGKIGKEEEKAEEKPTVKTPAPPKSEIPPKPSAPKQVQHVDTPAARLANMQAKEANSGNTVKTVASNSTNSDPQASNTSPPFGQTQGFSFNPAVHNRQQSRPFPNAAVLTPINPIAAIHSNVANQPVAHFSQPQQQPLYQPQPQSQFQAQAQIQPEPQFQTQPRREQKAQSKLYNNPQWLNFRANLFQLLKNNSLNDRMLDILTVLTFPDPTYLCKEQIEPSYRQIIELGSICYDAKEKKKQFLSRPSLAFCPLDKKKVGFELKDYLQSLKEVQPSKDFSKRSVIGRIQNENMEEEIDAFYNHFQGMTIATFLEMYVGFYSNFREDLSYLTEKAVKIMQTKHRIDALLTELKEEEEEEQLDAMMGRFERIQDKQESISAILARITQSLRISSEELPKGALNYEMEDLQAIEEEEECLRGEMASWRDQLCESRLGQPYKKIVNSFCECSIALLKRVEEIEARINALSASA